jgi:hypothetical protein
VISPAIRGGKPMEIAMDDLFEKVKAVVKSPQHRELFAKIVEDFYEQVTEEYFSPEDQADIKEGIEEIRQGKCIPWEESKKKHRL